MEKIDVMTSPNVSVDGTNSELAHFPDHFELKNKADSIQASSEVSNLVAEKKFDKHVISANHENLEKSITNNAKQNAYFSEMKLICIIVVLTLLIFLIFFDLTIVVVVIFKFTDDFDELQNVFWYSIVFFTIIDDF